MAAFLELWGWGERDYLTRDGISGKLTNKDQWAWPSRLGRDLDHFFVTTHFSYPLLWEEHKRVSHEREHKRVSHERLEFFCQFLCINLHSQEESTPPLSSPWLSSFCQTTAWIPCFWELIIGKTYWRSKIEHSHSIAIVLSTVDLTHSNRVGLTDITCWSITIQNFFSTIPNGLQKITYTIVPTAIYLRSLFTKCLVFLLNKVHLWGTKKSFKHVLKKKLLQTIQKFCLWDW